MQSISQIVHQSQLRELTKSIVDTSAPQFSLVSTSSLCSLLELILFRSRSLQTYWKFDTFISLTLLEMKQYSWESGVENWPCNIKKSEQREVLRFGAICLSNNKWHGLCASFILTIEKYAHLMSSIHIFVWVLNFYPAHHTNAKICCSSVSLGATVRLCCWKKISLLVPEPMFVLSLP